MAIRKFTDITNETSTKYDRYKNTQIKATIEDVFDTGSASNSPNDAAIQFLKEKIDDIIEETNVQIVASSSLETKIKTLTSFPGFGTSNTTALRGNTTTISSTQANAITANTAKVGYSSATISGSFTALSSSVASDIATNTAKVTYDKNLSNTNHMGVVMTVNESRGTYSLTFTMTHGKIVKTATVALS